MWKLAIWQAAIVALIVHAPRVQAQPPAFDAVSVKPSDPASGHGTVVNMTPGEGLRVVNATLRDMIETAYDVRQFQIQGGPSWAGASKYDVAATSGLPAGAKPPSDWKEVRLKAQAMLKQRFQLELHRETRELPIYSLVVAKGGVKPDGLSATDGPRRGINAGKGTMLGEAATIADLVSKLSRLLDRPVVDHTGLQGNYDFKLQWTPDMESSVPEPSAGPSLFTAIQQQLGLRLEATKGPVEVLVIDRVERPSEN
jgi:uncharacterized protein (TIGR03435 family)